MILRSGKAPGKPENIPAQRQPTRANCQQGDLLECSANASLIVLWRASLMFVPWGIHGSRELCQFALLFLLTLIFYVTNNNIDRVGQNKATGMKQELN